MATTSILALSSSRAGGGGYLEAAAPVIEKFLGDAPLSIAFIPFASVDGYEEYGNKVREGLQALPCAVNLATPANAKALIEQSDVIMIGGGNTFKLLHDLYGLDLVGLIKRNVQNGKPYIGWSAGANLTGPTLCTTNDMPVVQPQSFASFGFFPFQINPHYHNLVVPGFHGETRDQRLEEFLKMNPGKKVMALPEGTYLLQQAGTLLYHGIAQGVMMSREEGQTVHQIIQPGETVNGE